MCVIQCRVVAVQVPEAGFRPAFFAGHTRRPRRSINEVDGCGGSALEIYSQLTELLLGLLDPQVGIVSF